MSLFIAIPTLSLAVIYLLLWAYLRGTHRVNEPPVVLDALPFLGPAWEMLKRRYRIFLDIREKHGHPMYTLRFPGLRMYVVDANWIIPLIERQTRTFSFAPIEAFATSAVLGTSKTTNKLMVADPESPGNHFAAFRKRLRPILAPAAPCLGIMMRRSFEAMARSLDDQLLQVAAGSTVRKGLLAWTGHEIMLAGTTAEYGAANPFCDAEVEQAWWKFQSGLPIFISGLSPWIFARQSYLAREFLVQKFQDYLEQGRHFEGSGAVLARLRHNAESGMPLTDSARGEVGACMALLNNTVPGMFWLIYHVFSDRNVLADLREELRATAVKKVATPTTTITKTRTHYILDVARVLKDCPILHSTVQEIYRFRGIGTGMVRAVLEDKVLLANDADQQQQQQYLLRKGGLVFAPNSLQHFSPALWGPDCHRFDHRRFLRAGSGSGLSLKAASSAALRIFGAGAARCPGRHFAGGNMLVFIAMLVLRVDIRPVNGKEEWERVTADECFGLGIAAGFLTPDRDVDVEITSRGGLWEDWEMEFPEDWRHR
ncbi:cytochrome P450 [Rhypophila sp. PSN 637]